MILLNEKQSEYLLSLDETGMGYQTVNITLKDGTVFKNVIIIDSKYIVSKIKIKDSNDISRIELAEST
jgi:hypothetical protein